jgi:hypothetical protein
MPRKYWVSISEESVERDVMSCEDVTACAADVVEFL